MLPFLKKSVAPDLSPTSHPPQLAMLISAGKVKCTIYELIDHTIHIRGIGESSYAHDGTEERFAYKALESAAADAIDAAVQVAEVDVHACVFGVPQSWLHEGTLKSEYNEHIEKISRSLDIEGVAFVSIPHAIAYYLQYEHKVQPTTYLIGCTREGATISYVEKGKVVQAHKIAWTSAKVGQQIAKGLALFSIAGEKPTSMYLYGTGDLRIAKSELETHNWTLDGDKPSFVAKPSIILLEGTIDVLALSLVGAKDYARQHQIAGRLFLDKITSIEQPVATPEPSPNTIAQDSSVTTQIDSSKQSPEAELLDDLAKSIPADIPATDTPARAQTAPLGFVVNADIRKTSHASSIDMADESDSENADSPRSMPTYEPEEAGDDECFDQPDQPTKKMFAFNKKFLIILAIAILFILGAGTAGAFYAYQNIPTVEVTVFAMPKTIDKNIEITAATDASISTINNTVPLQKVDIEIKETATTPATGTKEVGESAKGTVTIYNKTTNDVQVKQGSVLKVNNIEFATNSDITIDAASESLEGQVNGKADVAVTARAIGINGNIKAATTLAVGTSPRSDLEAVAKADFTGGTQETVKVVAAKDITTLSTLLRDKAKLREPELLNSQTAPGEINFEQAVVKGKENITNNKKVNDEANEIQGEISYTISTFIIRESDVNQLLDSIAEQSVPTGYQKLENQSAKLNTEFVAFISNRLTFRATSSVSIIPTLDIPTLQASIAGLKPEQARTKILENPDFLDVTFSYNVTLPPSVVRIPSKLENITIKQELREVAI